MNVSLTANRFLSETSSRVCNDTEEEKSPFQFVAISRATHIHNNGVNTVGTLALWVSQAAPDIVEPAIFRARAEDILVVAEAHVFGAMYANFRIKFHVVWKGKLNPG